MFEELSTVFITNKDDEKLPKSINTDVFPHLTTLENDFERNFPELNGYET